MIVRFVDIGGIVDHHCFNFLFIIEFSFYTTFRDVSAIYCNKDKLSIDGQYLVNY